MRPIKFRFWNKKYTTGTPKMIYFKNSGYAMETLFFTNHSCNDSGACASGHYLPDNLMQFTGLKDKNGVEIYEGDIIKNPKATAPEDRGFEVCFENHGFKYKMVEKIEGERMVFEPFNTTSKDFEVIGSIYETPELIKEL